MRVVLALLGVLAMTGCGSAPPPPAPAPADVISQQRERINDLDRQIVDLLAQRKEASEAVQRARTSSGGGRVDPAREQVIIDKYRAKLGDGGERIARAMLEAFRGPAS
ncbi:chorismate mutase [Allokutzneria sp. A3M-2-11 16]|uniref:chorismate mutase n=1 Tax=Allokutzneria sp. A3M-2-11 16 TaxID=2962043 RepID=UPI0020B8A244|nr:chorismate mutase [Allokutzneria sp. A3M-2-11 16]MCP3797911.1 chorismate mutase [Allokutzneria sp. A3M-2-11 16]